MLSAPALFNVGSLLVLFMFIFAIFGMNQFSQVEKKGAINEILNFETFPKTFMLLFQVRIYLYAEYFIVKLKGNSCQC